MKFDPHKMCMHLRWKQMFYQDPDAPEKEENETDLDTRQYWCELTQTGRGPDEQPVARKECCPGRACCEQPVPLDLT